MDLNTKLVVSSLFNVCTEHERLFIQFFIVAGALSMNMHGGKGNCLTKEYP